MICISWTNIYSEENIENMPNVEKRVILLILMRATGLKMVGIGASKGWKSEWNS